MLLRVFVTLKPQVLDPAGKAVLQGLHALGFAEVEEVRLGKVLELRVAGEDRSLAEARAKEMCQRLLANTVVEDFRVEVE